MAKITLDLGHALSRLDQHRNRQQPYLISTGSSSYSFSGNCAAKFPKKFLATVAHASRVVVFASGRNKLSKHFAFELARS
jgi:hypothetical protein